MAKVPKADGARPRAKVVKRARASHRAFLHLRLCMLAARTIENEYLRNAFDMRNGADKIHRLPTLAQGRCGFMLH